MGILALCLYAAALFGAAACARRRSESSASFLVNSRSSSGLNVGLSIVVSCVGASATLGVAGMAFSLGTPAFWWLGAGAAGLFVLGIFLAKTVRRSGAVTMPQMVEDFLGKPARPLISLVIVVSWMAILAAQFSAMTAIVGSLTDLGAVASLAVSFLLIVAHTLSGGQAAVMRIDGMQFVVVFGGLAAILAWLTGANPAWPAAVILEPVNGQFPPSRLLYYVLVIGANYIVCPMLFGRLFSARDAGTARRGALLGAGGLVLASALIVSVGLACRGSIPADTPSDAVLTTALAGVLPGWLNTVILVALLSAVVSSADSCLITAGTVLACDLLRRKDVGTCRMCVAVLGCVGAAATFMDKSILGFLLMSYDVYACGVVAPVLVGLLCSAGRRVDARFACLAVLAGGVLGGTSACTENVLWSYAGLAASAGIAFLGLRRREFAGEPAS